MEEKEKEEEEEEKKKFENPPLIPSLSYRTGPYTFDTMRQEKWLRKGLRWLTGTAWHGVALEEITSQL